MRLQEVEISGSYQSLLAKLLVDLLRTLTVILQISVLPSVLYRVGHLIFRALPIRASNPQNALARISFHSPLKLLCFLCTTCISYPYPDHAATMAGQLAISLKTSSICSSRTPLSPLNHKQLSVLFFLFLFNDFRNPGNILPHIGKESLHIFNLPGEHALIMNNSLTTLSRTW